MSGKVDHKAIDRQYRQAHARRTYQKNSEGRTRKNTAEISRVNAKLGKGNLSKGERHKLNKKIHALKKKNAGEVRLRRQLRGSKC